MTGWYCTTRSIPARAGETCLGLTKTARQKVYPRTGGGNRRGYGSGVKGARVYPRTGGGNSDKDRPALKEEGLSPHGRGKPSRGAGVVHCPGSIPARAGETFSFWRGICRFGVYPRTGGGNFSRYTSAQDWQGLSPHGRGKRRPVNCTNILPRSIPARAGETTPRRRPGTPGRVYPRTGGGNRGAGNAGGGNGGLSPHGRGKRMDKVKEWAAEGSIPARAGETRRR